MCNIRYRDLFANFELTMNATCRDEKVDESFPGTMVINAFRGFLDEFRNSVNVKKKEKEKEKKRKKPHKKRKREKDTIVSIRGFAQESYSTVRPEFFFISCFTNPPTVIFWKEEIK